MRYVKSLGVAAVVAAALVTLVGTGTASATVFCKTNPSGSPTGTICPAGEAYGSGTEIHAVLDPGTKYVTTTSYMTIECTESTFKGGTNQEGDATNTVVISLDTFTVGGCNCDVRILKAGTIETHWISGTHNGTVTSNGLEETVSCVTIFGTVHCIYLTVNTDIGTLTGGTPATIDATEDISRLPTNGLCDEKAIWHVQYKVTTPATLYVSGHT